MAAPGLSRLPRDDARRPGGARGDAAVLHRAVRQPREQAARVRLGRAGGGRARRARRSPTLINASARRDRLHQRRDRIEQPRDQGRAPARCASRGNHVVTVATEHKSVLDSCTRLEREGWRVTRLGVDARRLRRSRRAARRGDRRDRARVGDGRQQRDRRAAAARPRSRRSCTSAARCCTPTPRRRPARCRSTSPRWASICCR